MAVRVVCQCGANLKVREDKLGELATCPKCKQPVRLTPARPASADTNGTKRPHTPPPLPPTAMAPNSVEGESGFQSASSPLASHKVVWVIAGAVLVVVGLAGVVVLTFVWRRNSEAAARQLVHEYDSAAAAYARDVAAVDLAVDAAIEAQRNLAYYLLVIEDVREDPKPSRLTLAGQLGIDVNRLDEEEKRIEAEIEELPETRRLAEQKGRREESRQRLAAAEERLMKSSNVAPGTKYEIAQVIHARATTQMDELKAVNAELREEVFERSRDEFLGEELASFHRRISDPAEKALYEEQRAANRKVREMQAKLEGRSVTSVLDEEQQLIEKDVQLLNRWKTRIDEFMQQAETDGTPVDKRLQEEYSKLWTTDALEEQQAELERATRFLDQAQAEMDK